MLRHMATPIWEKLCMTYDIKYKMGFTKAKSNFTKILPVLVYFSSSSDELSTILACLCDLKQKTEPVCNRVFLNSQYDPGSLHIWVICFFFYMGGTHKKVSEFHLHIWPSSSTLLYLYCSLPLNSFRITLRKEFMENKSFWQNPLCIGKSGANSQIWR